MKDSKKISADELKWRAEEDARTLERYQEIIKDKDRLKAALTQAEKQVDNLKQRADAIAKSITTLKK